jgi:hypothetical protein
MPIWVIYLLKYVLPAVALVGAAWWVNSFWCNGACEKQETRAIAAEQKLAKLDAEAIAQREKIAQGQAFQDAKAKREEDARKTRFAGLAARAGALSGTPAVTLSADADRLLRDATAAHETGPAADGERPPAAVAIPGVAPVAERDFARWVLDAKRAYEDADAQFMNCVAKYDIVYESSQ